MSVEAELRFRVWAAVSRYLDCPKHRLLDELNTVCDELDEVWRARVGEQHTRHALRRARSEPDGLSSWN